MNGYIFTMLNTHIKDLSIFKSKSCFYFKVVKLILKNFNILKKLFGRFF